MATKLPGLVMEVDAPREVVEEFRQGLHAKMALAKVRQERINAGVREVASRLLPGTGQLVASIDADVYFAMMHKFGPGCWSDKDFLKDCQTKGLVERPRVDKEKVTIIRP